MRPIRCPFLGDSRGKRANIIDNTATWHGASRSAKLRLPQLSVTRRKRRGALEGQAVDRDGRFPGSSSDLSLAHGSHYPLPLIWDIDGARSSNFVTAPRDHGSHPTSPHPHSISGCLRLSLHMYMSSSSLPTAQGRRMLSPIAG